MIRRDVRSEPPVQDLDELVERMSRAAGDVEDLAAGGRLLHRQHVGRHDVVDVREVARLLAGPVDGRRPALAHREDESRDDCAVLRPRVLVAAEDVEVAQGHGLEPVHRREHAAVLLGGELRDCVRRQRLRSDAFGPGQARGIAVDRRRGGEDEPADALVTGVEQHVQRPSDVDLARRDRVLYRARHRRQRPLVEDHVAAADGVVDALVAAQVALDELYVAVDLGEIAAMTGREVVEDLHGVPARKQLRHEVGADEAGTSCHQDAHFGARLATHGWPLRRSGAQTDAKAPARLACRRTGC